MLVAPVAAMLTARFGGRPVLTAGLTLQALGLAWLALEISPTVSYSTVWLPFVVSGVGMALFFVPLASVVLSSVRTEQEGVASGANSAFREVGGVLGIAVLGAVFSGRGGYSSGAAFTAGVVPAVWVGVAVVGLGAVVTLALPRRRRARPEPAVAPSDGDSLSDDAAHASGGALQPAGAVVSGVPRVPQPGDERRVPSALGV
jgi:MFS family permease